MAVISVILFYIGNRFGSLVLANSGILSSASGAMSALFASLKSAPFYIDTSQMAVLIGIIPLIIAWIIYVKEFAYKGSFREGEEKGSARWATVKEAQEFMDLKNPSNNLLYSKSSGMTVDWDLRNIDPADYMEKKRAWNNIIFGGTGSGKTYSYVIPNLLQCNGSKFVTDPKGDTIKQVGGFLAAAGYRIKVFNTVDMLSSMHYNPLHYVHSDPDILSFVTCLIANTTPSKESKGDPFWEKSETMLYIALIAYLRDWCPLEDYSLSGLLSLLSMAAAKDEDESFKSTLDFLFDQIESGGYYRNVSSEAAADAASSAVTKFSRKFAPVIAKQFEPAAIRHNTTGICPADVVKKNGERGLEPEDDYALSNYLEFKKASGKTLKSIIISCAVRLAPLKVREVRELITYDEMELDTLGDLVDEQGNELAPMAVFAMPSDTDHTFSFLIAIMIWQTIDLLCRRAQLRYGEQGSTLPRHVQFTLDEFATIGKLVNTQEIVAVVRSRNIGLDLIVQSLSQVKSQYDKDADTIIDNCDGTVFLGGKSASTAKDISEMIGKQTIKQVTFNETHGQSGSSTKNMQIEGRDLIDVSEIGRLSRRKALVLISGVYPFMDDKYPTHKHPNYQLMQKCKNFNFKAYQGMTEEQGAQTLKDKVAQMRAEELKAARSEFMKQSLLKDIDETFPDVKPELEAGHKSPLKKRFGKKEKAEVR